MAMPVRPDDWTLERVHALPDDGNRYELLDGELLVTPAPSWSHQAVLLALYDVVKPYVVASGAFGCLRLVERWRPGDVEPEVLLEHLAWQPLPSFPALSIDLQALFVSSVS